MMRLCLAGALSAVFVLLLGWAVLSAPAPVDDLPVRLQAALPDAGVSHPVTAVLLNFRSFDTLLEVAVLLVAVIAGLALRHAQPDRHQAVGSDSALLAALVRILVPLLLLLAGYVLWAGSHRPGGAFQAAALLAAAGVLLRLADLGLPQLAVGLVLKAGLTLGLAVFVGVGVLALPAGQPLLTYPLAAAGTLIVLVEVALTLSIGLTLFALFGSAPPAPGREGGGEP